MVQEGQVFGRWITISVTRHLERRAWICRCECGVIKTVIEKTLKNGSSTQCKQCSLKNNFCQVYEFTYDIGQRLGQLLIIDRFKQKKLNKSYSAYLMQCDCGATKIMTVSFINSKNPQSCYKCSLARVGQTLHGMYDTPTYHTWENMRRRCSDQKFKGYKYYGGKGVKVCERWQTFGNFLEDMGERPEGKVLDRIDSNGNYEKDNCRWVTPEENHGNRILINKTGPKKGTPRSPNYGKKKGRPGIAAPSMKSEG